MWVRAENPASETTVKRAFPPVVTSYPLGPPSRSHRSPTRPTRLTDHTCGRPCKTFVAPVGPVGSVGLVGPVARWALGPCNPMYIPICSNIFVTFLYIYIYKNVQ